MAVNQVATGLIADASVTSAKLATGAAVANVGAGGITSNELAASAVTPAKMSQPLTLGTAVASTSGTSIDFTSIPSWVKRITVMFVGVSTSGTSFPMIQIGAGSVTTTGYLSAGGNSPNAASTGVNNNTTGFILEGGAAMSAASTVRHGHILITNATGNTWVLSALMANSAGTQIGYGAGSITLSGTLDRVRITTVNGTDTFDAGSINILYE